MYEIRNISCYMITCGFGSHFQTRVFRPFSFFFFFFFFFLQRVNNNIFTFGKNTVYTLFMHRLYTVHGSHDTIYTFKNYFSIIILVFNFSKNKLYPNRPYIYIFLCIKSGTIFYFLIFYNHTILFLNVYFRESHLFM